MATIRIPTPLRKLTQGKEEVERRRRHDRRAHRQPRDAVPGHQGAHLRRERPGASLRQHLRQRRGHPLPQEPGHAGQGQRRDLDRPGDRGRALSSRGRATSLATRARSPCPRSAPTGKSGSRRAARAGGRDDLAAEMAARYLAAGGVGRGRRAWRRRSAAATAAAGWRALDGVDLDRALRIRRRRCCGAAARLRGVPVVVVARARRGPGRPGVLPEATARARRAAGHAVPRAPRPARIGRGGGAGRDAGGRRGAALRSACRRAGRPRPRRHRCREGAEPSLRLPLDGGDPSRSGSARR